MNTCDLKRAGTESKGSWTKSLGFVNPHIKELPHSIYVYYAAEQINSSQELLCNPPQSIRHYARHWRGYKGELDTVSVLSEFTDKEVKGNKTITAYSATKHIS